MKWVSIPELYATLDFGVAGQRPMGRLAQTGGVLRFQYDSQLIACGVNPSPYNLRFAAVPQRGPREFQGLPGVFADSLPDGWTAMLMNRRLRAEGIDPATLSALDRLALVGNQGLGALTFAPSHDLNPTIPGLSLDEVARLVSDIERTEKDATQIRLAQRLAGSLGGARPKAHIWSDGQRFSLLPAPGLEPWIVKFRSRHYEEPWVGAVEYAYSKMAAAAGILFSRTALVPSDDGAGWFATQRFDRRNGENFHLHSLAGMVEASPLTAVVGYEHLFKITEQLGAGSREEVIRRMAFNVFAANRDDHIRNHAFLMNSRGTWALSPAYDVTFSPEDRHMLMVGQADTRPSVADMQQAIVAGGGDPAPVLALAREVRDVVREWPTFARDAGLDQKVIETVGSEIANSSRTLPTRAIAVPTPVIEF